MDYYKRYVFPIKKEEKNKRTFLNDTIVGGDNYYIKQNKLYFVRREGIEHRNKIQI